MALEVDFAASQSGESEAHEHATPSMEIKYFNGEATESTGLVAAVECVTHLADGSPVLIALVVTGKGSERYITVEGIDRI
ncbi:hypothetical protein DWU99_16380 [Dyella psychrodurans]|uniref:Uncharacterized protein n=2 Tax=Dyella psychrodurans TaxID=1927960 RepID=A0A370X0P8_9GAMM|nr:hypothetical protein DWU99_16380 [Dyella psychrodurans]